jgi:MYXO-CTERM domain-containing protein
MEILMKTRLLFLPLTAAIFGSAFGQTISTTYNADIYDFGVPNTETYGQTFEALNSTLTSYTFSLYNFSSEQPFDFYVGTWNGSDVGTVLYDTHFSTSNPGAGYVNYTVDPDLALTTGDEYIAFESTSLDDQDYGVMEQAGSYDSYAAGQFVYMNNGTDSSQWYDGGWNTYGVPETAFTATFSAASSTPGPIAVAPFALGLLGAARRRRKA